MKKMKCIKNFYVMDEKEWYEICDVFDVYTIDEVKGLEYAEQFHARNSSGLDDDTIGYFKELDGQFLPVWRRDAEELVVEPKDVRRFEFDIKCHLEYKLDDIMLETFNKMTSKDYDEFAQKLSDNVKDSLYELLSPDMEDVMINVSVVGV